MEHFTIRRHAPIRIEYPEWGIGFASVVMGGDVADREGWMWYWSGVTDGTRCWVGLPGLASFREMEEWHFSRDDEVRRVVIELVRAFEAHDSGRGE